MNAKLIGILSASDKEAIAYCQMELYDMGYYVITDGINFVFGVPSTDMVTPAMLMAHIDTVRRKDTVLPAVYFDTVYNENAAECGCLGADDRAGVYITLEIAKRMANKPYVLYTTGEETGHKGAAAFLKADHPELATHEEYFWKDKSIIDVYSDDIYCILQYDRQGYNSVVTYGAASTQDELIAKAELLGYMHDRGTTSDSRNITEATLIAHLNLSAGFIHQHTENELLLLPAIDFAIRNGIVLCQMIDKPYRVTKTVAYSYKPASHTYPPADSTPPVKLPIDVMKPTCDICGKNRPVHYLEHALALICAKCIRRAGGKDKITSTTITKHQYMLQTYQDMSKKNNVQFLPRCPVDNSHTDVYPLKSGAYFCDECGTWFVITKMGTYWWDYGEATKAYYRFHDNSVSVFEVDVSDEACPLDNCQICGKLMPDNALSYYDNTETGEYTLIVCDDCNAIDPPSRRK